MASNPIRDADDFDTLYISGIKCPFIVEITGEGWKFRFTEVEATATIGASMTPLGTALPEFTVTFFLLTQQHFVDWDYLRSVITANPGKNGKAYALQNPMLNEFGIVAGLCLSVNIMRRVTDDGYFAYDSKWKRFAPPKKTAMTIKGTKDDKSKPGKDQTTQPEDEGDKTIRELTKIFQEKRQKLNGG